MEVIILAVITVKVSGAPYGSEAFYNTMRFVLAALSEGHEVNVFLLGDAVAAARKGQETPEFPGLLEGAMPNAEELLKSAIRMGARVKACGVCCKQRAITQEDMVEGCSIGSMKDLANWIVYSDKSVDF
ncbi:MAG TPA: hypothetical protein DEA47_04465 [Peptococcaceae bacterium]|nr:hypothetical protein [Peptococcaceae bacterium]